jgi:hypothetical protein
VIRGLACLPHNLFRHNEATVTWGASHSVNASSILVSGAVVLACVLLSLNEKSARRDSHPNWGRRRSHTIPSFNENGLEGLLTWSQAVLCVQRLPRCARLRCDLLPLCR